MAETTLSNRVISSAAALLGRSAWERLLSLVATLALARLLLPRDLGEASLVLVIVAFATIVVDAGITSALIREPEPPSRARLRAARRAQCVLAGMAVALAGGVAAVDKPFGLLILVDSLQLLTDPFLLERRVMLQRRIEFRGLALADGLGVLTRSVVSLAIAVPLPGPACLVYGDLSAALVYAAVVVFALRSPAPPPGPPDERISVWQTVRHGAPFQMFSLILSLRDLSSAALISGVVGLGALGLFQFSQRAISPVLLVFSSLAQLALPVGVHVINGDRVARTRVREGYLIAGLATAVILSVAASPTRWLVPALFGARWSGAVPLIFALALAVVINGPACSFGVGLVMAANRTRLATAAAAACAVLFLGTLFALSHIGGLVALAVAWDVSAAVEVAIVLYACRRYVGVDLVIQTLMPVPVFVLAFLAARWAGSAVGGIWPASVASAGVALVTSAALSLGCGSGPLSSLWKLVRHEMRPAA